MGTCLDVNAVLAATEFAEDFNSSLGFHGCI
jgi:hypothetical protein